MAKAISVRTLDGLHVEVHFDDGRTVVVDLSGELFGPVFGPLRTDPALFKSLAIDELGGVEWANGASLAPDFVSNLVVRALPA